MATILLVITNPDLRRACESVIAQRPALQLWGSLAEWDPALASVRNVPPQVAMVDLDGLDQIGLARLKAVRQAFPDTTVWGLVGGRPADYHVLAERLGADGIIGKEQFAEWTFPSASSSIALLVRPQKDVDLEIPQYARASSPGR